MKLSIITINYNNEKGLQQTFQSVAAQAVRDFEYIVIDGNSTDGSKALIEAYSSIIDYWVSESDGGIYQAMNKGVKAAHGDYCLFLNSGDTLHDALVAKNVMGQLDGCDFYTGHILKKTKSPFVLRAPETVGAIFLLTGFLAHQATFIKTGLLRHRPYQEQYRIAADWEQMVYELIFHDRTYRQLDLIIADFDMGGISSSKETQAETEHEREIILDTLLSQRLKAALVGCSDYERKIHYALAKAKPLERDRKILRNSFKMFIKDLFHISGK